MRPWDRNRTQAATGYIGRAAGEAVLEIIFAAARGGGKPPGDWAVRTDRRLTGVHSAGENIPVCEATTDVLSDEVSRKSRPIPIVCAACETDDKSNQRKMCDRRRGD